MRRPVIGVGNVRDGSDWRLPADGSTDHQRRHREKGMTPGKACLPRQVQLSEKFSIKGEKAYSKESP